MEKIVSNLKSLFFSSDQRIRNINYNILGSFLFKSSSILISLILVPLTIGYLSPLKFGIWITLSSIITWLTLFDIGLSNGLRNKFAEAVALGQHEIARKYVSTAYFIIIIIVLCLYVSYLLISNYLEWDSLLNAPTEMKSELNTLVHFVIIFFAFYLVLKILTTILIANQKPAFSDLFVFASSLLNLIGIYIISKISNGSLFYIGIIYSSTPVIILLIGSIFLYKSSYMVYRPNYKFIEVKYIKLLFSLGIKFFILQLFVVIIYSTDSLIISQLFGPQYVTPYNIAFRYFSVIILINGIIMLPLWSGVTDAYTKGDLNWIKQIIKKKLSIWVVLSGFCIVMLLFSDKIYSIWVGELVAVPFHLSLLMAVYAILYSFMVPFVYFINGVGKINLQLIITIVTGLINIPISILLADNLGLGISGVILGTIICIIPFCILMPIQYSKIINRTALNIWDK